MSNLDIKIGISSNANFYKKTIPVCVGSIIDSGFNPDNVYVFIGGFDGDYEPIDVGFPVKSYKCPHNSFDFTSVVSIVENGLNDLNWFLLHDTIEVDKNFYEILKSELSESKKKVNVAPSMSMGSYDSSSFELAKKYLHVIKNITKEKCIMLEDVFISDLPSICNGFEFLGLKDVYGTGVERFIEYYKEAGIKKNKANNGTKPYLILDV